MLKFTPVVVAIMALITCPAWSQEDAPKVYRRVIQLKDPEGKPRVASIVELDHAKEQQVAMGTHWIGLACGDLGSTVKAQLKIDHGMPILQVLPDSPAQKAGLQAHDIVLEFGDAKLENISDLVEAVNASKDEETTLTYLRGGKKKTVKITPVKRPDDHAQLTPAPTVPPVQAKEALREWIEGRFRPTDKTAEERLLLIGPGILEQLKSAEGALPKDVSIRIEKDGAKPAAIIIKKDGKTYKATQDNLDELPEDIRKLYDGAFRARVRHLQVFPQKEGIHAIRPGTHEHRLVFPQVKPEIRWTPAPVASPNFAKEFEEIRKEMQKMRMEIEKLKK